MSKVDKVRRIATGVGSAVGLAKVVVSWDGKLLDKTKPGGLRLFGIPIFTRGQDLKRTWFGVIDRGRSQAAKEHLRDQESERVDADARARAGDPDIDV